MRKDYWKFVEWIWSKRDQPYLFRPSTVTESNRKDDSTLPEPALEPIEATELFDFLADKELLTEKEVESETVFRINKIEAHRWRDLIKELKKPDWKRSWLWNKICSSIFWIITLIISGSVGTTIKISSEHLSEQYKIDGSPSEAAKDSENDTKNDSLPDDLKKPEDGASEGIVPEPDSERPNPVDPNA